MSKFKFLSLVLAGTVGCVANATAAHIDLFDSDDFALSVPGLGTTGTGLQNDVASTPGVSPDRWDRTVSLTSVGAGPVSFGLNSGAITDSQTQGVTYSGPTGSLGIVTVEYTGFVADFLNIRDGSGVDTGNDWTRIDALFQFASVGQVTVNAQLTDADGTMSTVLFGPQVAAAPGALTTALDYALFDAAATGGTGGLDFTMINSFTLTMAVPSFDIASTAPITFDLTDLRRAGLAAAVPVPASLMLIGFGLVMLRRKSA